MDEFSLSEVDAYMGDASFPEKNQVTGAQVFCSPEHFLPEKRVISIYRSLVGRELYRVCGHFHRLSDSRLLRSVSRQQDTVEEPYHPGESAAVGSFY